MTVGSLPRTSPRLEELVMPHVTPLVLRHMGSSLKFPNNLQGPSSTDGDAWSPQRAGDTERLRHRRSGPVRLSLTSARRVSRRASAPCQGCAASDQASVPRSRPHLTSPFPMTRPRLRTRTFETHGTSSSPGPTFPSQTSSRVGPGGTQFFPAASMHVGAERMNGAPPVCRARCRVLSTERDRQERRHLEPSDVRSVRQDTQGCRESGWSSPWEGRAEPSSPQHRTQAPHGLTSPCLSHRPPSVSP